MTTTLVVAGELRHIIYVTDTCAVGMYMFVYVCVLNANVKGIVTLFNINSCININCINIICVELFIY